MGYDFTSGLQITLNSIHRQKHFGICLPTVGSQTWVRSGWEFFRPIGESNPRPWRWIKSARDQHVKCNERRTRPCHRAYYIRGSTPFHSCVEVWLPKLVSSEDRTGARAPYASYCSKEGVAPLHTAPPTAIYLSTIFPYNFFLTFSTNSNSASSYAFFIPIMNKLRKAKNLSHISTFLWILTNSDETAWKKKNGFYKCFMLYNLTFTKG